MRHLHKSSFVLHFDASPRQFRPRTSRHKRKFPHLNRHANWLNISARLSQPCFRCFLCCEDQITSQRISYVQYLTLAEYCNFSLVRTISAWDHYRCASDIKCSSSLFLPACPHLTLTNESCKQPRCTYILVFLDSIGWGAHSVLRWNPLHLNCHVLSSSSKLHILW